MSDSAYAKLLVPSAVVSDSANAVIGLLGAPAGVLIKAISAGVRAHYGGLWIDGKLSFDGATLSFQSGLLASLLVGERKNVTIPLSGISEATVRPGALGVTYLELFDGAEWCKFAVRYWGARRFCANVATGVNTA